MSKNSIEPLSPNIQTLFLLMAYTDPALTFEAKTLAEDLIRWAKSFQLSKDEAAWFDRAQVRAQAMKSWPMETIKVNGAEWRRYVVSDDRGRSAKAAYVADLDRIAKLQDAEALSAFGTGKGFEEGKTCIDLSGKSAFMIGGDLGPSDDEKAALK